MTDDVYYDGTQNEPILVNEEVIVLIDEQRIRVICISGI